MGSSVFVNYYFYHTKTKQTYLLKFPAAQRNPDYQVLKFVDNMVGIKSVHQSLDSLVIKRFLKDYEKEFFQDGDLQYSRDLVIAGLVLLEIAQGLDLKFNDNYQTESLNAFRKVEKLNSFSFESSRFDRVLISSSDKELSVNIQVDISKSLSEFMGSKFATIEIKLTPSDSFYGFFNEIFNYSRGKITKGQVSSIESLLHGFKNTQIKYPKRWRLQDLMPDGKKVPKGLGKLTCMKEYL